MQMYSPRESNMATGRHQRTLYRTFPNDWAWPNCHFGADGLVAVKGRRKSADRYAQHTCPSTPAGGQQGPTLRGLADPRVSRRKAVVGERRQMAGLCRSAGLRSSR